MTIRQSVGPTVGGQPIPVWQSGPNWITYGANAMNSGRVVLGPLQGPASLITDPKFPIYQNNTMFTNKPFGTDAQGHPAQELWTYKIIKKLIDDDHEVGFQATAAQQADFGNPFPAFVGLSLLDLAKENYVTQWDFQSNRGLNVRVQEMATHIEFKP